MHDYRALATASSSQTRTLSVRETPSGPAYFHVSEPRRLERQLQIACLLPVRLRLHCSLRWLDALPWELRDLVSLGALVVAPSLRSGRRQRGSASNLYLYTARNWYVSLCSESTTLTKCWVIWPHLSIDVYVYANIIHTIPCGYVLSRALVEKRFPAI